MKILFLVLIATVTLLSEQLKDDLLQIHATLIPKIMMMDYDFEKRLVNDEILIGVVYAGAKQKNDALALNRYIQEKYPDGYQKHKIRLEFIAYDVVHLVQKHTLYYLLPTVKKEIKTALKIAHQQEALSFSYRDEDLKYGVMLSVKVTNKVKPVINVDALKETNVSMRPVLLKVADIFFQTSSRLRDIYDQYSLRFV